MIKKYIKEIIQNGKEEDMYELEDILEDVIYILKDTDYNKYKKYKLELMGMANNYKFDEETAKEIVSKMKPLGEEWDIDTIKSVKNDSNIPVDINTLYIVMNAMANDYGKVIDTSEVDTYIQLSLAFINDEDAKEDKVFNYFTKLMKED